MIPKGMIRIFLLYLPAVGMGLSLWYSLRLIRRVRNPDETPTIRLAGRREKGILIFSIGMALVFGMTILFGSIFWKELRSGMIWMPLVYLLAWTVPRLFVKDC